LSLFCFCS